MDVAGCANIITCFFTDRVDSLDERQKTFFSNCNKKNTKNNDKESEFENIKGEYKKVIEEAGEKVLVAEECYGLVDRYLRKLDEELHKFKMELEADNRGITEILEKHSLDMEFPPVTNLKENRLPKKLVSPSRNRMNAHVVLARSTDFFSPRRR
jgi:hypothetical protein